MMKVYNIRYSIGVRLIRGWVFPAPRDIVVGGVLGKGEEGKRRKIGMI